MRTCMSARVVEAYCVLLDKGFNRTAAVSAAGSRAVSGSIRSSDFFCCCFSFNMSSSIGSSLLDHSEERRKKELFVLLLLNSTRFGH